MFSAHKNFKLRKFAKQLIPFRASGPEWAHYSIGLHSKNIWFSFFFFFFLLYHQWYHHNHSQIIEMQWLVMWRRWKKKEWSHNTRHSLMFHADNHYNSVLCPLDTLLNRSVLIYSYCADKLPLQLIKKKSFQYSSNDASK